MKSKVAFGIMLGSVLLGLIAVETGRTCRAGAPRQTSSDRTEVGESKVDTLVLCIRGCSRLDCLRSCASQDAWPRAFAQGRMDRQGEGAFEEAWTPELGVNTRKAIENVTLCGDRYFGPGRENSDPQSHGVCVSVAVDLLLFRMGWGDDSKPSLSPVEGANIHKAIDLVLAVADIARLAAPDAGAAQSDGGDQRVPPRQEPGVRDETTGQVAQVPPTPPPTFKSCHDKYDENVTECNSRYPAGSASLTLCLEGAAIAFRECAKKSA